MGMLSDLLKVTQLEGDTAEIWIVACKKYWSREAKAFGLSGRLWGLSVLAFDVNTKWSGLANLNVGLEYENLQMTLLS